jgi:hypothetical protein
VRSGWVSGGPVSPSYSGSSSQQVFSYYCQNSRNDHEHETCGSFDVLSNGEYITKQRTVFNNYNMMLATAEHSNILGAAANQSQTTCTIVGGCWQGNAAQGMDYWRTQSYVTNSLVANGSSYYICTGNPCASTDVPGTASDWTTQTSSQMKGGGQMWHGQQSGRATLYHSELPGYVAAVVDTTGQYSGSTPLGWGGIAGVTAASRSLIYLRGSNRVVTYDRAAGAQYSRDWLTTTGAITIAGNTASWLTRSANQKAYATSLLPAGVTLSDAGAYQTNENGTPGTSDWEPYSHLMEDAGSPSTVQFLNVLEWGATAFTKSATGLVQSSSGAAFDGAGVGSSLVMFSQNYPVSFTGTTFPASGATTIYVSDLTPNTTYAISGAGAPESGTTDTAGVLTFAATGTGNVTVGSGTTGSTFSGVQASGVMIR